MIVYVLCNGYCYEVFAFVLAVTPIYTHTYVVLRQSQSSTEGPSHKQPPVDTTAHRVQRDVSSQENFSGSTHKGVSRQKSQKTTSSQGSIEPQETVANKVRICVCPLRYMKEKCGIVTL